MLPQASLQLTDAFPLAGMLGPQALHLGPQAAELLAQVRQHAIGFLQRLGPGHAHSVCQTRGSRQLPPSHHSAARRGRERLRRKLYDHTLA